MSGFTQEQLPLERTSAPTDAAPIERRAANERPVAGNIAARQVA